MTDTFRRIYNNMGLRDARSFGPVTRMLDRASKKTVEVRVLNRNGELLHSNPHRQGRRVKVYIGEAIITSLDGRTTWRCAAQYLDRYYDPLEDENG